MRVHRMVGTALLLLAVAATPSTASAADACPGVSVGGNTAGVCESFVLTPTPNTGYTVSGGVDTYCTMPAAPAVCLILALRGPDVDATGADVNGNTPPVPTFDPSTGQLSAPAGTYATVYADGTAHSVDTPAYCVTINVRCP